MCKLEGFIGRFDCIKLLRCISLAHLNIVVVLIFLKFLKIEDVFFLRCKSIINLLEYLYYCAFEIFSKHFLLVIRRFQKNYVERIK